MAVKEYSLPNNLASIGYCVFPSKLEDDELVLFHGTPAANYDSILENGFLSRADTTRSLIDADDCDEPMSSLIPSDTLQSVSFARRSVMALDHVCLKRKGEPGDYWIIAVRFKSLNRPGIENNPSDVHVFKLDPPPSIIARCMVPASYKHD